jgi:hypothetical protein
MNERWPELHWADWSDTCATLHLWTQIAGKIRMAKTPPVNHWWHVPLYLTTTGLGTSPIPDGARTFSIDFDFIAHRLRIASCDGDDHGFALEPMSVADFYGRVMRALHDIGVEVRIYTMPSEIENAIPFERDTTHASYDAAAAERFWCALVQADRVLKEFRARFIGKCSPVHFFWGSFDLAVTRFSGKRAPKHPGSPMIPDFVTHEAYSHEVASAGFWPGGPMSDAMFYAYAYPEPDGYASQPAGPPAAFYSSDFREFVLPYEAVRTSEDPDATLLDFLQTTYEAGASLLHWDRGALERS